MQPRLGLPILSCSISRKMGLALAGSFFAILFSGGLSSFLAWSILSDNQEILREGHYIETAGAIHVTLHHLLHEMDRMVIENALDRQAHLRDLRRQTAGMIAALADQLRAAEPFPEKDRELALVRAIQELYQEVSATGDLIISRVAEGARVDGASLSALDVAAHRLPALIQELDEIHQAKSRQLIVRATSRMKLILGVYLAFLLGGAVCVSVAVARFSRSVTFPLRRLAAATREIANGNFEKRLPVGSRDEIGQLAQSFNEMAERLRRREEELYRAQAEVRSLAAVQERERIAREMHDGLAQAVGYIHLRFKTLEDRLERGGQPPAVAELAEMRAVAKRAYANIRQSIFGLRTAVSKGVGLVPILTDYLREFSQQSGIPVELQIEEERATHFTADAEVQLIRVIQEALTNVWKHAAARQARVRFALDRNMGCVTIADDGVGLPAGQSAGRGPRRFGLQTMRERVESVGGSLEVESWRGRGTEVVARVPLGAGHSVGPVEEGQTGKS